MFYIYRQASSTGARQLAEALDGVRARNARQMGRVREGDVVVYWGDFLPTPGGVVKLNAGQVLNKVSELRRLAQQGISTVQFSTAPAHTRSGVEWLGRTADHTGGLDLLKPPARPDFWVRKEALVREVRVHSFRGKSIRAGLKIPREGFTVPTPGSEARQVANGVRLAHAWVRSWDGGWRIAYSGQGVKQKHRDLAHAAVAAMGLDFGAVDIGERKDGSLVVLEVNRAPGLEGGTIEAYAKAIQGLK